MANVARYQWLHPEHGASYNGCITRNTPMTIRFVYGNIFVAETEALVCPVNLRGVMGAGLAKHCHQRWRGLLASYREACFTGELRIGSVFTYSLPSADPTGFKYVVCLPTKVDWQNPSRLEYVEEGVIALATEARYLGLQTVAVSALGCGCGGLEWEPVREVLVKHLARENKCQFIAYEPMRGSK